MIKAELLIPSIPHLIVLETNDMKCIELAMKVYPHISYCGEGKHIISILKRDDEIYDFSYFPYIYKSVTGKDVMFILCEVIDSIVENSLSQLNKMVLHGGVVEKNCMAIGFLAKSHTGKSTLIFELSSHGYGYVADDIIIYDYEIQEVVPFHIPIKLRNFEPLGMDTKTQIIIEGTSVLRSEYTYLAKGFQDSDFRTFPLRALVVLNRDDKEKSIQRLNYAEAYEMLIMNGKIQDQKAIYMVNEKCMELIREVPVFKMHYNSLADALSLIDSLEF